MIWSIAWKNIWRNKKRSLVVITSVTLGIIAGVLLVGIMEGWTGQRLHSAIYYEVSHIQIHNSEYVKNEEINLTVSNPGAITAVLDTMSEVSGWSERTKVIAMANTSWASTGVVVYGIDPEKEKQVTEIYKKIVTEGGSYPETGNPGDILISDKTAELLKLKQYIITDSIMGELSEKISGPVIEKLETIKDKRYRSPKDFNGELKTLLTKKELDNYGTLIDNMALDYRLRNKVQITMSDTAGNPVQGVFRVCGIYKTDNTGFDQAAVFVNAGGLASLYGSEPLIHEIAVLLYNIDDVGRAEKELTSAAGSNSVMSWRELAPDAALMSDFMVLYYFIFIGIIMFALAFGIINTMLMAILERTRELGMLMAIGMNRRRVFNMIMLETFFLTAVGAVTGILFGWAFVKILGKTGIHFAEWGEGFEAIGYASNVYPVITPEFFAFITVMVIVTAVLSSIWPARKALKLNPVEALRTE
jgi:putative ABC transport system permease protein